MADMGNLIIVGASARSAAQSAIRAGWRPVALDLFADRDLAAIAPVTRCPIADYPDALPDLAATLPPGPLLLTGAMENHLATVQRLAAARRLIGPSPSAIAALRALPWQAAAQPDLPGIQWCEAHQTPPTRLPDDRPEIQWIIKPHRSAGGSHVRPWLPGTPPPASDQGVQQFIEGISLGVLWRSHDDGRCDLLGTSRQLLGDSAFGAEGLRYVGSLGPFPLAARQAAALTSLGRRLTTSHRVTGLWGADVILDAAGRLWPIEFNPRYTASVEVLEHAGGFAALAPAGRPAYVPGRIHGKAIVFARRDAVAPDLAIHFAPGQIADVPAVGERIPVGRPICTVLASAASHADCLARLRALADRVYTRCQP